MKNYNYKLVISTKKIYQEIALKDEFEKQVYIGTTSQCAVRFGKENYSSDFEICVQRVKDTWQLICGETVCFVTEGFFRQKARILRAGDSISIQFRDNKKEIVKIAFLLDFGVERCGFEGYINIAGMPTVSVGKKEYCNISLMDKEAGNNEFHIIQDAEGTKLQVINVQDGLFLNGFQIEKGVKKITGKDFIMTSGYVFFLSQEKLYISSCEKLQFQGVKFISEREDAAYPHFHRTTRVKSVLPEEKIEILSPKAKEKKPEKNLLLSLLPILMSMVLMIGLRTMMGGGGYFVIYSAATMGLGIVTSIFTYRNEGKEYRKNVKEREKKYLQYLSKLEKHIREIREKELRILNETYISLEEAASQVENFDSGLFEKNQTDGDYLVVRVGTGTVRAKSKIIFKEPEFKETEDELMDYPAMIAEKYEYIANAPICTDLKKVQCLGVVGEEKICYQILKNITLDLAIRHHYNDVKFIYFLPKEEQQKYKWLRWLKNVQNGIQKNIVFDEASRKNVLEEIYSLFAEREGLKKEEWKGLANYVIFVCGEQGIARHPVSKYIENCNDYGITFLFFAEEEKLLPTGCGEILLLNHDTMNGQIINTHNKEEKKEFSYSCITEEETQKLALRLGSIYVDEVSLEGGLTKNVSLYSLLHIAGAADLDLKKIWERSRVYKSMAAPLGLKSGDEIVYLDLNEKKHGPHGLVAGTTGSGKSEILLSYILSMAVKFHPYEVGFVIIDFKGGGMANQLRKLPHLIGTITNIDGHEMERSLLSIKAELRKRQELFALTEVNHIDDYIKKYKMGETETALPHLILIVDEFAELKTSQPEFMQELISAARIGRSLGVHLILATQKPAGVVNDQIWSNSKFKLCLKVQNKSDSNEVLKSPLAAEIREPGRAYLQVGNNEIFELFQSAYSGEAADSLHVEKVHEYKVCELDLAGRPGLIFEKKQEKQKQAQSQLEAVVEHIESYCRENGIQALPGICLPSLAEVIPYPSEPLRNTEEDIRTRIGIYDAPQKQQQEEVLAEFTKENIFVLGSSQYGKTNFLSVLVKGLVSSYSPKQVNIYILDFASMVLKVFENLNHVGGVVTSAEDEKLFHFFKMMDKEIKERKEILSEMGLSSFSAYLEAGYEELPQIVIMVDNLTVLKELYFQENDRLLPICREGITVGISVVVVNSQSAGIGFRYLNNFSRRIAFYCNNSSEYNALFEHCRIQPGKIAGRGIMELEKTIYEFQSYLAFSGEKEVERVKNMREFIDEINSHYEEQAACIPQIPKVLTRQILRQYPCKPAEKLVVGLDYETIAPVQLPLTGNTIWGFAGKEELGKGMFLKYLFHCLEIRQQEYPLEAYILDDTMESLGYMEEKQVTRMYGTGIEKVKEVLEVLKEKTDEKQNNPPIQLLVIQDLNALEEIQKNKDALALYKRLVQQAVQINLCIWLTNVPNAAVAFSSPEPLKAIKEKKQLFLFENLGEQKIIDIPMSITRNYKKPLKEGDAYYACGSEIRKIKIVEMEQN